MADQTPPRSTTSTREPPAGPGRGRMAGLSALFGPPSPLPPRTASYNAENSANENAAANVALGWASAARAPPGALQASLNAANAENAAGAAPRQLEFRETPAERRVREIEAVLVSENPANISQLDELLASPKWANYRVNGRPVFFRIVDLEDVAFAEQALRMFKSMGLNINLPDAQGRTFLFEVVTALENDLYQIPADEVDVAHFIRLARVALELGADPAIMDRSRRTNAVNIVRTILMYIERGELLVSGQQKSQLEELGRLLSARVLANVNVPGAPSRKRRRNALVNDPSGGPESNYNNSALAGEAPNMSNSNLGYAANMNVARLMEIRLKQLNARIARQRATEERERAELVRLMEGARERAVKRRTAVTEAAALNAAAAAAGPGGLGAPLAGEAVVLPAAPNAAAAAPVSGAPPPPPPPPAGSSTQMNVDPGANGSPPPGPSVGGRRKTRRYRSRRSRRTARRRRT